MPPFHNFYGCIQLYHISSIFSIGGIHKFFGVFLTISTTSRCEISPQSIKALDIQGLFWATVFSYCKRVSDWGKKNAPARNKIRSPRSEGAHHSFPKSEFYWKSPCWRKGFFYVYGGRKGYVWVKYSPYGECEIIRFANCEISYFAGCEMKFVPSHAPAYFTAEGNFTRVSVFHSFRRNEFHWKSPCISKGFFYGVSSGSRTHDLQGHNLAL